MISDPINGENVSVLCKPYFLFYQRLGAFVQRNFAPTLWTVSNMSNTMIQAEQVITHRFTPWMGLGVLPVICIMCIALNREVSSGILASGSVLYNNLAKP